VWEQAHFWGVRRIFAQISPNLPKKMTFKKRNEYISSRVGRLGAFFEIKALQVPLLPEFSLTCRKELKKHDFQTKKTPALSFWVPFL